MVLMSLGRQTISHTSAMAPPSNSQSATRPLSRGGEDRALDRLPSIVRAPRTDAIYNCHAYLTKVPVEGIKPFVEVLTTPGETVLDMFAGSGMTGVAATSLGRQALLSDISVLGQHIGRGYLTSAGPSDVRRSAKSVVNQAKAAIGDLYRTNRISDGTKAEVIRTIWSFVYLCPKCGERMVYFEHVDADGRPPDHCPKCSGPFARRSWSRSEDEPVRVVVDGEDGKQIEQAIQRVDLQRIERARKDPRQAEIPSLTISPDREMFSRSGLARAGVSETKQFFSPRNALALLELWKAIGQLPAEQIRQKLRFAFTACLARASRRYQWGPKRPLNAQNQTYYVAPIYFEWNVFELFERKVEAVIRSDELIFANTPLLVANPSKRSQYELASADRLTHVPDESVAYVFTDPPFGSNIFYADMNLFHEAWLGTATDDEHEAVMHTTGKKKKDTADRYETLLRGAFSEAYRVLRPGRFMSVVFGNSSGGVWSLVQRALRDTGFTDPLHAAILDKGQRSVKGLNSGSEGVVTLDLVLTVQKPERRTAVRRLGSSPAAMGALLAAAVAELDAETARNPSYVYVAALRQAIRLGQSLEGLHYSDVLLGLRTLGFSLDAKNGLFDRPVTASALAGLSS